LRALAVAVALAAVSSACEISRPVELHPDAVALYVLLAAGETEARMLAVQLHRDRWDEEVPDIAATLEGPGWTARFADTLELEACLGHDDNLGWRGLTARCLRAVLPDTIRPGATYGLSGTAPTGSFTGEMTVPAPPLLLEPEDGLRLTVPEGRNGVWTPVRFRIGSDVDTLMVDKLDFFEIREDGSEVKMPDTSDPYYLVGDSVDFVCPDMPIRFSLRLLGFGRRYTAFMRFRVDYRDQWLWPWPDFGIEGEHVYGYFDGFAPSRSARIFVAPPQTGCARP